MQVFLMISASVPLSVVKETGGFSPMMSGFQERIIGILYVTTKAALMSYSVSTKNPVIKLKNDITRIREASFC